MKIRFKRTGLDGVSWGHLVLVAAKSGHVETCYWNSDSIQCGVAFETLITYWLLEKKFAPLG
jgi:hypothetical protein